jgi:hypothetical protein
MIGLVDEFRAWARWSCVLDGRGGVCEVNEQEEWGAWRRGWGLGFYGRQMGRLCQVIDESVKLLLNNRVSLVRCPREEASGPLDRVGENGSGSFLVISMPYGRRMAHFLRLLVGWWHGRDDGTNARSSSSQPRCWLGIESFFLQKKSELERPRWTSRF